MIKGNPRAYGNNGILGVCTTCVDLVPVFPADSAVGWRCGNEPHTAKSQQRPWTPTIQHRLVPLTTAGYAFCRAHQDVVYAESAGAGRWRCTGLDPWRNPLPAALQERKGLAEGVRKGAA